MTGKGDNLYMSETKCSNYCTVHNNYWKPTVRLFWLAHDKRYKAWMILASVFAGRGSSGWGMAWLISLWHIGKASVPVRLCMITVTWKCIIRWEPIHMHTAQAEMQTELDMLWTDLLWKSKHIAVLVSGFAFWYDSGWSKNTLQL